LERHRVNLPGTIEKKFGIKKDEKGGHEFSNSGRSTKPGRSEIKNPLNEILMERNVSS